MNSNLKVESTMGRGFSAGLHLLAFGALIWVFPAITAAKGLASPVGIFEGTCCHGEPITFQFDALGGMRVISELELFERESVGLGSWRHKKNGISSTAYDLEFGYLSYREGSQWLCVEFDPAAVAATSCTLIVTGEYSINNQGILTGEISISVKDRGDGGDDYTVPIKIPIEATRISIEDLQAVHQFP